MVTIKYSEIYAADPETSVGANDLVIFAKVDGGEPTGFKTHGILFSDFSAGMNSTIYNADDTLSGPRKITQDGNYTWFEGGNFHLGPSIGFGNFSVDHGTTAGVCEQKKRDKDPAVGGNGFSNTLGPRGEETRNLRNNGEALTFWNEWTIGDNRKSFVIDISPNGNGMRILNSLNGTELTTQISDTRAFWLSRAGFPGGFAFGHNLATNSSVDIRNLDFKVQGSTDPLLFEVVRTQGVVGIGGWQSSLKLSVGTTNNTQTTAIRALNTGTAGTMYALKGDVNGAATTNIALQLTSINATNNYSLVAPSGRAVLGATTSHASALLELTSTTQGLRLTPMTAAQASLITVVEGLMVVVSTTDITFTSVGFWVYEGGVWTKI